MGNPPLARLVLVSRRARIAIGVSGGMLELRRLGPEPGPRKRLTRREAGVAGGGISIAEASAESFLGDISSAGAGVWYYRSVSWRVGIVEQEILRGG